MRKVNSPYFNSAFYTITFSHVYKVSQPTAGETSAVISLCYVTSISSSSCSELRCDYGWICEHHEWLGVIWKMRILANIWIYSITTETHRLLLLRNACRLAVILVFLFKEELHHALPFFPPSYLDSLVILKIHSHPPSDASILWHHRHLMMSSGGQISLPGSCSGCTVRWISPCTCALHQCFMTSVFQEASGWSGKRKRNITKGDK